MWKAQSLILLKWLKKSFNKLCAGTQWRAPQFRSFRLPRSETPQDATVELWVGILAQGGQIDSAQPREWRKNGAHVPDQCAALRLGHCRLFYWKLLRDVCIIATDPALLKAWKLCQFDTEQEGRSGMVFDSHWQRQRRLWPHPISN